MRIGILAAGDTPRRLADAFGHYPTMFEGLLDGHGFDWRVFDVAHGDFPERPETCDAYIVTGAAAGVYDPDPWIGDLLGFLRKARGKAKLVGVCFGHQALAQAFGGQVIKSPKGWGVGLHTYEVGRRQGWMDAAPAFSLSASHQDQVVNAPPGATVVAGSDFCPYGMLAYGDEAISLQLHPEFAPDYSIALIAGRRGDRIPEDLAERAIASLKQPDDHEEVAGWIARFLAK
ncbi:MAG TPA: type 1 glutamine amidotransferase [Caulobacteraceae bacterium]|nr:type 1 glutamine amidotransferase [Caulobacteraceae bacterium]